MTHTKDTTDLGYSPDALAQRRAELLGSMPFCMELDPQHQCVVRA